MTCTQLDSVTEPQAHATTTVWWVPGDEPPVFHPREIAPAVERVRETVYLVRDDRGATGLAFNGTLTADGAYRPGSYPIYGVLPPTPPEGLGDPTFGQRHGAAYAYVVGEMANGIAGPAMVVAAAKAGTMGFFGAAGLAVDAIERALERIEQALAGQRLPWGANLIHSPDSPELEDRVVSLYLRRGVTRMSASAFITPSPAVIRYAVTGLRLLPSGRIERRNAIFAKVSRTEVARQFLAPARAAILDRLLRERQISSDEAMLAARVPVAEDITVEADSGGHTDNRPLGVLLPSVAAERDRAMARYAYDAPIRVGGAGGLATPSSLAAAFALGAAYVMTGSINQAAVEAETSPAVKKMLAAADPADCAMAPAGDMFEAGARVQVLKRGTMFAARANRLRQIYLEHDGLHSIPAAVVRQLENDIFHTSFEAVWNDCREYWGRRDGRQVRRAETDPKHRMGLMFRWYLGKSSAWGVEGNAARSLDYQIWCGPAMGAFNQWAAGTFLEEPARRSVVQFARNLLEGAAVMTRAHELRRYRVALPSAFEFRPRPRL